MSLKRTIIAALDTPLGRPILARLATLYARRLLKDDVEIGYAAQWYHRVDRTYVPDGRDFDYYLPSLLSWRSEIDTFRSDAHEFWLRDYKPKPGDVIIDIGAGRGEDVLAFAEGVGPTGKVIALEAHPETFARLKAFCDLNGFHQVTPIHAAVMDKPGSIFIDDRENWEHNTAGDATSGYEVKATTIDSLVAEHGLTKIDFLKMNIEGAERQALPGMTGSLPLIRHLCISAHDFRADRGDGEMYRTRDFVLQFLNEHGFSASRRADSPVDYVRDHIFGSPSVKEPVA